MLRLHMSAPYGAFRTFTAGSFRPTAPFVTPSAAYGLVLNLAGIESRFDDGKSPVTLMKADLPRAQVAIGAVRLPDIHSIYQQLHNYPVGTTGKERARDCMGAKYNIQPIRREFLSGIDAYVCVRGNETLEACARDGLQGRLPATADGRPRYGIPFLGDNSFMIDVLREEPEPEEPAYWYRKLSGLAPGVDLRHTRMTVWIDRADMTKTVSFLYAPLDESQLEPPEDAWTTVAPPETPAATQPGKKRPSPRKRPRARKKPSRKKTK